MLSTSLELCTSASVFAPFVPLAMHLVKTAFWFLAAWIGTGSADTPSTAGIEALVKRRLPDHADAFEFRIRSTDRAQTPIPDIYTVTSADNGKILVEGTTLSALASGYGFYLIPCCWP